MSDIEELLTHALRDPRVAEYYTNASYFTVVVFRESKNQFPTFAEAVAFAKSLHANGKRSLIYLVTTTGRDAMMCAYPHAPYLTAKDRKMRKI